MFPILYKRNSNGSVQQWQIFVDKDKYWTEQGKVGGKITRSKPQFGNVKNLGKSNETTSEQQAQIEAEAKFQKRLNENYFQDINCIDDGFKEPMLAKKFYEHEKKIKYPVCVDIKLNGIRCNFTKNDVVSRKNKPFFSIPHIKNSLIEVFKDQDVFIDGELYNFDLRNKLNRIVKLASVNIKEKDLKNELLKESEQIVQYHIYDGYGFNLDPHLALQCRLPNKIESNTPFVNRRKALKLLFSDNPYIKVLDINYASDRKGLMDLFESFISNGEEGAIIRPANCIYEHKRTHNLLKLKKFIDDEFKVVDIEEGTGNWTGCAKRIICKLNDEKTFASNIEGSMEELKKVFNNKEDYIGKMATIRFQELSEYGVPLIPYLIAWRDYE